MATVFTIAGLGDPSSVWGDLLPSTLEFQMMQKITAGNDVVNIVYPGLIGFDSLLLAAGPLFVQAEDLPTIAAGIEALDLQINNIAGEKIVFCHSLGCIVAAQWLQTIGPFSDIPPADLTFVFMGNPVRRYGGVAWVEEYGVPADTEYTVTDYSRQYDYFSDFPNNFDSPYYLMAIANVLAGWVLVHPFYMFVDPDDVSMPSYTEGNITYILSPTRPWWIPDYLLPFIEDAYDRVEGDSEWPQVPMSKAIGPSVRYPTGPITPHGAHMLLNDRVPTVKLRSPDDSVVFNVMGGEAIPDRQAPERVELKGIKGLVGPWTTIDQKGATQDGVTFIDALYDPIEVTLDVVAHGRTPAHCRRVVNHLIGSIDAKQESELSWFTHEMGRWWAKVRWFKPPDHDFRQSKRQNMSLRLRADTGFWESYPDVQEYRFGYEGLDTFSTDHPADLGTHWDIEYSGDGTGIIYTEDGQVQSTLDDRTAVARFDEPTLTNNQVIEIQIGNIQQWFYPFNASIDVWARMNETGDPGEDGIRFRFQNFLLIVSSFNAGVETILWLQPMIIPPIPGETFTIIAGTPEIEVPMSILGGNLEDITIPGNQREYRFLRNGAMLMSFKEPGTTTQLGAGFRGVGIGFQGGLALIPAEILSSIPANIRRFSFGDNSEVNQTAFIRRINAGDQDAWDRYTCFGPGVFRFSNGPGSNDMVEFGPLLPNQVMQINTDPRKYGVKDLASTPTTPQSANLLQKLWKDFISFATGSNVPPLVRAIESWLGIVPPQGNPYRLLNGRFSAPVPAKSPGLPARPYYIKVEIDNGNADTKVIAALTPKRRYPF